MSARLVFSGLDELFREMSRLPADLRAGAQAIVRDETEATAREYRASIPTTTGRLARSVKTVYPSEDVIVGQVYAGAPHSHLFEFGTKARQTLTGANRGTARAARVLVPIATRNRLRMRRRLTEMVRRFGFDVTGDE